MSCNGQPHLTAWEEDPSAGVLVDTSGHGFDGTCIAGLSCPTLAPGVRGMAVRFDGATDDRVAIGKPVGPDDRDSWGLVAWSMDARQICHETSAPGVGRAQP